VAQAGRPTKARCPGRPWTGIGNKSTWNMQHVNVQDGHAGGAQTVHAELTPEQKQRRYNVLDQVVGWVTDLMTPDKASAADLRVG
jgi:hypothetical protein